MPTKNTRDRATEILPRLLYERLDEFGMDFTVLYPTAGLGIPFHPDEKRGAQPAARSIGSSRNFSASFPIA